MLTYRGFMTHSHSHAHTHGSEPELNDLLELDAIVLADYWDEALSWVAQAAGNDVGVILDLGTGVGTGALGLSVRFPEAEVVAIDISEPALLRLDEKATALGLRSRIRTLHADIDTTWPDVGKVDLTWASMAMHHFADPDLVLRNALASTRPRGLLAVAEFSQFLHFLPHNLGTGRPGFEDRIANALRLANQDAVPELGSAWPPRLEAAGWRLLAHRDFLVDLHPVNSPSAAAYASGWFERLAYNVADGLEPDDRATLAELIDPGSPHAITRRRDLHITGTRSVSIAIREDSTEPAGSA